MITRRVWFFVLLIGLLVGAGVVWTAVMAHHGPYDARPSTAVMDTRDDRLHDEEASHLDVYGNKIDAAVGDYRVDLSGNIYEEHSPNTEVPHLGPPIS